MTHYSRRTTLKLGTAAGLTALMTGGCGPKAADTQEASTVVTAPPTDAFIDATELARQIRDGALSASEAVKTAIDRARSVNPQINAMVTDTFDIATNQASTAPSDVNAPFAGVPYFIKDLMNVTGVATGFGSRAFNGFVPDNQFPFIDDLESNGLISIGRSATPEFGLTATTEPVSSGIARNPWNIDHSTGGSSGGAAALVAAGVVPMSHASDGGGSIRIPASCCGLVGLKVSRDRYAPVRDETTTPVRISVQGVVSRTVRDNANFLNAMQLSGDRAILSPLAHITGPAKQRLKIAAFTNSPGGVAVDPDVAATIEKTANLCAQLGHQVEMIECPIDDSIAAPFLLYWAAFASSSVSAWEATAGRTADDSVFEPFTLGLRDHFERNKDKLSATILTLIGFTSKFNQVFGEHDLLLSPVLTTPPPSIGYLDTTLDFDLALNRLLAYAQFTAPANIAGTPAISLPMGMSSDGLPIGAQFHGRAEREDQLLALAFELEETAPWIDRKPALFVG